MQIIDYGYKLPDIQDKDFWDSYNFDITRLSTHNHDGENSALLDAGHLNPTKLLIETGDWVGPTSEVYEFTIPLPSNVTWPDGGVSPVLVKSFENNIATLTNFQRVDDNNFKVTSRTNDDLVIGIY